MKCCATSFTTCCFARCVDQGILASNSATCTSMMVNNCMLFSTKYFVCSLFLVMNGMTLNFWRKDGGVFGIPRVVQKSSARRHERYPYLVMGANFEPCGLIFSLPLSSGRSSMLVFALHINTRVFSTACGA